MTSLERLDFKNITYAKAHEFSRVMVDAFRDEAIQVALRPKEKLLNDVSLPPISEYEQLLAKAREFESEVVGLARHIHVGVRSDWRNQLFILRDPTGKAVAGAEWSLPKYLPAPAETPSLFHRLKTLLLKGWYYTLSLFGEREDFMNSPIGRLFQSVADEYQCSDTDERIKQLEQMSVSELRDTTYPMSSSYYLHLFFVRSDQQGKKYGNQIMDGSLAYMKQNARPPPTFAQGAPPKATLQAVPNARGFYKRYGYTVGATAERQGNNGEQLILTYYFMNLD